MHKPINSIKQILRPKIDQQLLLVSDGAGWILDEVANQLMQRLPVTLRPMVDTTWQWKRARHSIIHFIERSWAWNNGVIEQAHHSNTLIGLWWHGRLDSDDPVIQKGLRSVAEFHPRFARIQVPTSIAQTTMLSIGVPQEKVVFLPEGVDLKRFALAQSALTKQDVRRRYSLPADAFIIGNFQKDGTGWGDGMQPKLIKGPDTFADALVILSKKHQVFALIPGPSRGYLENRLFDGGVPFLNPGHITHRDGLAGLYHALDVYISPSRDEGGPAGVMEAMASGIPVISTRSGVAVDIFEEDKNGLLVDVGDGLGMAETCEKMIEDSALRNSIASNGYVVIQKYDWSILAEDYYQKLYKPLLSI